MRNLLLSSSRHKPPRRSQRSQAFSFTFTSFCSRKGTFGSARPSLEVLPLSRLRKTGTPEDSHISWCPVISCCKGNKTPKLLCIAYKGLSDPFPVTSPSSLPGLQPRVLLAVPASEALDLLSPLLRKLLPQDIPQFNPCPTPSHHLSLSCNDTFSKWPSLTTHLLFHLQTFSITFSHFLSKEIIGT